MFKGKFQEATALKIVGNKVLKVTKETGIE